MDNQKAIIRVFKGLFDHIKKPFQSLLLYTKSHRLVSFAYFIIFAIGIFLRVFVLEKSGTMQWDEAAHSVGGVFISRIFLNGLNDPLGFIGSYVADYPSTIGGLWFYPPGYGLITSMGFLLLGFSDSVARLTSLIFSVLLIHATVRVTKEIDSNEKVSLISAFLAATSSPIIIVGTGAMLDIPQTTLIMYSILFWIKGMKNQEHRAFLKAGILGGLAGLIKPSGIFILLFMIAFQVLMFLILRDSLIFSKRFWKGIISGFLIFSTWWISAVVLKYGVGGWIGESAINGVAYWFDFFGVFGKYIPPWYSPQWYTYEGWTYYSNDLILVMGLLPFLFSFLGIFVRVKEMKRSGFLLVLFILGIYVLQSFASNKNPRYIITCLPILFIYSSIGLISAYKSILKFSPELKRTTIFQKILAMSIIVLFVFESLIPLSSSLRINYTPGMGFGNSMPIKESLQIVKNDGNGGIVIPDSEDNWFNVHTLTFYIASIDDERRYGCHSPPPKAEDILSLRVGDKGVKYVLIHDLASNVSNFVHSNAEAFVFIGKAENSYGSILVYRVA